MKKAIKKLKSLFLVLITIVLTLQMVSCDKDEFENLNNSQNGQFDLKVKKISFKDVKLNRNAFEKLKESRSKINPSLSQRGIYNEDFGVFIDTTNILITEKEGKHSITFLIIDDEDLSKVKNLVLNSKDDGSYSAFITEYILSQSDIIKLTNNEPIGEKTPSSVTDITTNQNTNIINSSNANCVSTFSYNQTVCWSGDNLIPSQGDLGDGCTSGLFSDTFFVIEIDWGCVSGGGSTGYNPGGSDSGGYNPGGYWTGGGSGSSGGSQTNPNNPVLTTPNIKYPTVPRDFLLSLSDEQLDWWNAIENSTPRNEIIDYLNNNKVEGTNTIEPDALAFALELIDLAMQNNATFSFDNTIDPNNALNFDSVEDFQNFLENISREGFDFELEDDLQTNQKTAKVKLALTGIFGGINFNIKQNITPTYSVANVTSTAYGFTLAFSWDQKDYNVEINNIANTATVTINGDIHYNVFIDGLGTVWSSEIEIKVVLNTTTGQ